MARAGRELLEADTLAELVALRAVAEREHAEAQARLAALAAGSRAEDISAARADLAGLDAHLAFLREQLACTELVSPIAGIVVTRRPEDHAGAHLPPGELLLEVQELETVHAEIAVPEKELGDLATCGCGPA